MSCLQSEYTLDMDIGNMCRICMSQTDASERLFHIFTKAIVDGFLVAIPDVLEYCVDLKVLETDGMPSKICQKCKGQLLAFYLFKQKCQRTDKALQQALGISRDQKDSELVLEAVDPIEDATENSSSPSENNFTVEVLESAVNYDDNVDIDSTQMANSTDYHCHLCDHTFQTEDGFKDHTANHCAITADQENHDDFIDEDQLHEYDEIEEDHKIVTSNVDDQELDSSISFVEKEDTCTEDDEVERTSSVTSFSNSQSIDVLDVMSLKQEDRESIASMVAENEEVVETNSDHISNADEQIGDHFSCHICQITFKGRSRYFKHLQTHEVNMNITEFLVYHICQVCMKVFLQETELADHVKVSDHLDPKENKSLDAAPIYSCGICSVEYLKIDHVKQHLLSHLQTFACPFAGCGCEYASSARLKLHIVNKHIEYETHQCQHCGVNSFESMAELQQHLRLKCNAKMFHCNHCDKKFLSSRSLAHHLKGLEKKHRCSECGKAFAQHGELKLHERIHNGERPFKCTVCGKSYKTASLRTAHMDSHIDGKTFQCQLCGKQLQTRTCYRNHIKRHSEERKYECDVCSKKFYTKYNVKVHKQKVHKLIQGVKQENIKTT